MMMLMMIDRGTAPVRRDEWMRSFLPSHLDVPHKVDNHDGLSQRPGASVEPNAWMRLCGTCVQ
jgi:hypothetical protein